VAITKENLYFEHWTEKGRNTSRKEHVHWEFIVVFFNFVGEDVYVSVVSKEMSLRGQLTMT